VVSAGTTAPVLGALLGGRPLLLAPAGGEQPLLTGACLRAGAAVRIPPEAAEAAQGAALITSAIGDPVLAARTRAVGDWLRQSKSESRAADLVESAAR
jgi:UDP:flavonoid glycosyltransferase YjiC (YdhE family)